MDEEVKNDTTGAAVWQDGSVVELQFGMTCLTYAHIHGLLIFLAETLKLIYLNRKLNASYLMQEF